MSPEELAAELELKRQTARVEREHQLQLVRVTVMDILCRPLPRRDSAASASLQAECLCWGGYHEHNPYAMALDPLLKVVFASKWEAIQLRAQQLQQFKAMQGQLVPMSPDQLQRGEGAGIAQQQQSSGGALLKAVDMRAVVLEMVSNGHLLAWSAAPRGCSAAAITGSGGGGKGKRGGIINSPSPRAADLQTLTPLTQGALTAALSEPLLRQPLIVVSPLKSVISADIVKARLAQDEETALDLENLCISFVPDSQKRAARIPDIQTRFLAAVENCECVALERNYPAAAHPGIPRYKFAPPSLNPATPSDFFDAVLARLVAKKRIVRTAANLAFIVHELL